MRILLTHPGTQYAPLLATVLYNQGILYQFATGIAFGDSPQKRGRKRCVVGLPSEKIYNIPLPDAVAVMLKRMGCHNDYHFYHTNAWFEKLVPHKLINQADLIIGFDTSSRILVKRAYKQKKPFILDASIAHPLAKEQVFQTLRNRYPLWAKEIRPKLKRNIEAELMEMELATHIVAASTFTQNTYIQNGISSEKISVNPYGTNLTAFSSKWQNPNLYEQYRNDGNKKLKFLFFGSISARKGFPWLCEVWQQFLKKHPSATLIAAGHGKPPARFKLPEGVTLLGSISPAERTQFFHSADVFVFPSFFEGFGQVIIEAMACGLPVITTSHTIGAELINNKEQGFIISPGNNEELMSALEYFMENVQNISIMGAKASLAVQHLSWHAYGARWKQIAEKVIADFAFNQP